MLAQSSKEDDIILGQNKFTILYHIIFSLEEARYNVAVWF